MLGGFCVRIGDREVVVTDWRARRAQELVALLALSDGHRLVRDQVIEHLWPHLTPQAGAANLRKAAHHARRALGAADAVVLRGGSVELFPERTVVCDVARFLREGELALQGTDDDACARVAESYGGLPNAEIIAFADDLADEAQRLGAARGHAFALTLRGEAKTLAGRLDEADSDFADGARLHGQIGARAGEALSLLGRGQVATYRRRPERARPFLADALLMARESEVGHHTLDRIYGAMVEAAGDSAGGFELVREAESAIRGPAETCPTCRIAFIVPAAIAAARAGDLARADRYARDCETALETIALPPAWHAAVAEVRGWVARANGEPDEARDHLHRAADGFRAWGQPLDAQRCAALAAR